MVAITLGLMILAGLTTLFVNNVRTQNEIEAANRKIENGRYAMQLMSEDLRHAGFYGEFNPLVLASPASLPDPCLTTVTDLKNALRLHVQGYDNESVIPALSCLTDVRAGTDILVVRHTSTCAADSANCEATAAGIPYFQASLCNDPTQLGSPDTRDFYALDSDGTKLNRTRRDCSTPAAKRRYRTHIYFIANNNVGTDGIPTLKRAELGSNGASTVFTIVPLVDGIENMQVEYGIYDTALDAPKDYTSDVSRYAVDVKTCATPECVVQTWENVVSVKLHLLARNLAPTPGHSDDKSYQLGANYNGTANALDEPADAYKRQVFQSTIVLTNPAGRYVP